MSRSAFSGLMPRIHDLCAFKCWNFCRIAELIARYIVNYTVAHSYCYFPAANELRTMQDGVDGYCLISDDDQLVRVQDQFKNK